MLELQEKTPETKDEKKLRRYKYEQHYVFHPEEGEKLVSSKEYQTYLQNGWYDCTSKFPKKAIVPNAPADEKEALIKRLQEVIDSQSKVINELKAAPKQDSDSTEKELVGTDGKPAKGHKKG